MTPLATIFIILWVITLILLLIVIGLLKIRIENTKPEGEMIIDLREEAQAPVNVKLDITPEVMRTRTYAILEVKIVDEDA